MSLLSWRKNPSPFVLRMLLSIEFQDPCGDLGAGDCDVDAKDREGYGKSVG